MEHQEFPNLSELIINTTDITPLKSHIPQERVERLFETNLEHGRLLYVPQINLSYQCPTIQSAKACCGKGPHRLILVLRATLDSEKVVVEKRKLDDTL